jgi:Mg2+ and Co2+ transporter CorA
MNAQLSKLQARLIENIFKVQEQTYKVQKLATSFQEQATASQKQTAMDSKLLKSLTMLATLYLPLNLVVVSLYQSI